MDTTTGFMRSPTYTANGYLRNEARRLMRSIIDQDSLDVFPCLSVPLEVRAKDRVYILTLYARAYERTKSERYLDKLPF